MASETARRSGPPREPVPLREGAGRALGGVSSGRARVRGGARAGQSLGPAPGPARTHYSRLGGRGRGREAGWRGPAGGRGPGRPCEAPRSRGSGWRVRGPARGPRSLRAREADGRSECNFSAAVGCAQRRLEVLGIACLPSAAAQVVAAPGSCPAPSSEVCTTCERRGERCGRRWAHGRPPHRRPPWTESPKPATQKEEARADPRAGGTEGASIHRAPAVRSEGPAVVSRLRANPRLGGWKRSPRYWKPGASGCGVSASKSVTSEVQGSKGGAVRAHR